MNPTPAIRLNTITGILVDDLSFDYRGNQLTGIIDAIPATTSTIGFVKPDASSNTNPVNYTGNGAIKHNYYNEIAGMTYNVLNLQEKIRFMYGHAIQYSYDMAGTKRQVIHQTVKSNLNIPLGTTNYTPSSGDIQSTLITDYCAGGHIIYENNALKRILNPEGYVTKQSNSTSNYYYYAKDHLGNNRAVFGATTTTFGGPQQEINYYPLGMPFYAMGILGGYSTGTQPYKFGDKEYDEMHGLNWYDFGARYYSGIIPVFMSMDPLCEKYYSVSPHAYCLNNPVRYVDPDDESVHLNRIGDVVAEYDDGDMGGKINMNGLVENRLAFSKELALNMNMVGFGLAVKARSDWDLKSNWNPKTKKGDIWGYAWYFDGENKNKTMFTFGGYSMTAADFGNFHYGYTGKFTYQGAGMPDIVLEAGAGVAEIGKNAGEGNYSEAAKGYVQLITLTRPYGDRPIDNYWIRIGIRYANKMKSGKK